MQEEVNGNTFQDQKQIQLIQQVLQAKQEDRMELIEVLCKDDHVMRENLRMLINDRVISDDNEEVGSIFNECLRGVFEKEDPSQMASKIQSYSFVPKIGDRLGSYRIVKEIARGGMGVVFLAVRENTFKKTVALKVFNSTIQDPAMLKQFRKEREILAKLVHPFIAQIQDGGTTCDGAPYFVMEYVEGLPIDEYCYRNNLSINERLRLVLKVCDAIRFAHSQGVVHRDLKPSNIFVREDGVPKLLDFGIAELLGSRTLTFENRDNVFAYTPEYASPEQLRCRNSGKSTDMYSIGALLFQLLTGRVYNEVNAATLSDPTATPIPASQAMIYSRLHQQLKVGQIKASEHQWRKNLREDFDFILNRALKYKPSQRYDSIGMFARDLKNHLDTLPISQRNGDFSYTLRKFYKRHRINGFAVCGAAAIFVICVFGFYFRFNALQVECKQLTKKLQESTKALKQMQGLTQSMNFSPGSYDARSQRYAIHGTKSSAHAGYYISPDRFAEHVLEMGEALFEQGALDEAKNMCLPLFKDAYHNQQMFGNRERIFHVMGKIEMALGNVNFGQELMMMAKQAKSQEQRSESFNTRSDSSLFAGELGANPVAENKVSGVLY